MQYTLQHPNSVGGGPVLVARKLTKDHTVFVVNLSATDDIYLSHTRQGLMTPTVIGGITGYRVDQNTREQIPDWVGDMWAAASVDGVQADFEVSQSK